eukprot:Hpha_TRINITY_DN34005_c0_g1::TRINITY_DN34005_c0_g1_i1::g.30590::m.30590
MSLRQYWHPVWEDSLLCTPGTAEQWAWGNGYTYLKAVGTLRTLNAPGQVAVKLFRHPKTGDSRLAASPSSVARAEISGYALDCILGFGYPDEPPPQQGWFNPDRSPPGSPSAGDRPNAGRVRLLQWWHPERRDHRCLLEGEEVPEGYVAEDPKEGPEVLCWALAASPDSCGSIPLVEWNVGAATDRTHSMDRRSHADRSTLLRSLRTVDLPKPTQLVAASPTEQELLRRTHGSTPSKVVAAVESRPFGGCIPLWRVERETEGAAGGFLVAGCKVKRPPSPHWSSVPHLLRVTVFGKGFDHRQYCFVEGFDMQPSDAGTDVYDCFSVHRTPLPGLTCWAVVKVPGERGNVLIPAGRGLQDFVKENKEAKIRPHTVQALFWAREVDLAERGDGGAIFVRWRKKNADWATSVSHSKYQDQAWRVLYAFDPATPEKEALRVVRGKELDASVARRIRSCDAVEGLRVHLLPPGKKVREWCKVTRIYGGEGIQVEWDSGGTRTVIALQYWDRFADAVSAQSAGGCRRVRAWPPGAVRLWRSEGMTGGLCSPPDAAMKAIKECLDAGGNLCIRRAEDPTQYVRMLDSEEARWPLKMLAEGRAISRTPGGKDVTAGVCAVTWEGPLWAQMQSLRSPERVFGEGWISDAGHFENGLRLCSGKLSDWCGRTADVEVWLEPRMGVPRTPPLPPTNTVLSFSERALGQHFTSTYAELKGESLVPPEMFRQKIDEMQVYTAPHPAFQRWEIRRLRADEGGTWVAPAVDGGLPVAVPAELKVRKDNRCLAVFWSPLADPSGKAQKGDRYSFLRYCLNGKRAGNVLDGWYEDKQWQVLSSFEKATGDWMDEEGGKEGGWTPPDILVQDCRAVRVECFGHSEPGPGLAPLVLELRLGQLPVNRVLLEGEELPEGALIICYVAV